jgi:DNA-directed RNA polymerase subunit K/omega
MSKNITEKRAVDKDCKYSYVMAVVKRAKELRRVTKEKNIPLDEISVVKTTYIKPLSVALEEYKFGKIDMKLRASLKGPGEKPVLDVVGEKKVAEEKPAQDKKSPEEEVAESADDAEAQVAAEAG